LIRATTATCIPPLALAAAAELHAPIGVAVLVRGSGAQSADFTIPIVFAIR
jgi:hypothetical protein